MYFKVVLKGGYYNKYSSNINCSVNVPISDHKLRLKAGFKLCVKKRK